MLGGYLRPSVGLNPENRQRLAHWASYLKTLADPWILYADCNFTPAQLRLSGFLELLGGAQVVTASDTSVTCRAGGGRAAECATEAHGTEEASFGRGERGDEAAAHLWIEVERQAWRGCLYQRPGHRAAELRGKVR